MLLQFWPNGSVSPTQNLRCRGSLCQLLPTFPRFSEDYNILRTFVPGPKHPLANKLFDIFGVNHGVSALKLKEIQQSKRVDETEVECRRRPPPAEWTPEPRPVVLQCCHPSSVPPPSSSSLFCGALIDCCVVCCCCCCHRPLLPPSPRSSPPSFPATADVTVTVVDVYRCRRRRLPSHATI
jgi:hypothetical protein